MTAARLAARARSHRSCSSAACRTARPRRPGPSRRRRLGSRGAGGARAEGRVAGAAPWLCCYCSAWASAGGRGRAKPVQRAVQGPCVGVAGRPYRHGPVNVPCRFKSPCRHPPQPSTAPKRPCSNRNRPKHLPILSYHGVPRRTGCCMIEPAAYWSKQAVDWEVGRLEETAIGKWYCSGPTSPYFWAATPLAPGAMGGLASITQQETSQRSPCKP